MKLEITHPVACCYCLKHHIDPPARAETIYAGNAVCADHIEAVEQ